MSKLGTSLILAAGLMTWAAWAADAPFVGQWKLDAAKSQLTDQMKVTSLGDNKFAFDFGVGTETIHADGTDQPGYGGTTLAVTLEGPDALKVVRKKDGHMLLTANWKLSQDGGVLSDDFTTFSSDGSPSNLKYEYRRTTQTQGFAGTWESASVKVGFDLSIKIQAYEKDGLSIVSPLSDKPKDLSFDGKDYPNLSSNAPAGSAYSAKRIDERTMTVSDKLKGKLLDTQEYALSADLKTLTLTIRRVGMQMPNIFVFERK